MSDRDRELVVTAQAAAAGAYAPYSGFRVGAVVVADDGRSFTGVNVENAAFGSTMCAEANAMASAVTAGVREIEVVAVACLDGGECYPCGNCRQMMRELSVARIVVQDGAGGVRSHTLDELLPHAFGPESLGG